ncbi:uncharacterized protein [Nicotiana tomentosiformis]|uniref:uncharacterized protein n=1 Tax=Nicotiana tomentosiformis TaxID=4098 RepID=UPI00388C44D4
MCRGAAQLASSATTTSATPPPARGTPALTGHGAARGGTHSSGGPSHFYAMRGVQSLEASPYVVTSILTVQSHDVYALIDPGSTLSYVTPYVAMEFGIEAKQLHEPFSISTPVGESIMVAQGYRDCVVTKAVKLQWSDACERSFQELKSRLTMALVLTLPDGMNGFVRCLELLEDYDIDILCHMGKANVVAYALSRKSIGSLAHLEAYQRSLAKEVHRVASFGVPLAESSEGGVIV